MADVHEKRSPTQAPTNAPARSVRRDAFARQLCARICDERLSVDSLELLDAVLAQLERGDRTSLLDQFENDRFNVDEDDGTLYRHGFNAAMRHATALVRIDIGLTELRRSAAFACETEGSAL